MGAGWCVVSVLFHPFLLFVGAAIYMVSRHVLGDREITVAGRTLSMPEKKIGVAGVTVSAVLLVRPLPSLPRRALPPRNRSSSRARERCL